MADAASLKGQGNNDWAKAESILKDNGYSNYSSGLRNWVLTGAQDYSYSDAQQYGLPMSQSMIQGEQTRLREEAIKPVVDSLESSRGEINTKYDTRDAQIQAEKDPLLARYDKVLSDITGRVTQQNVQEFSRRGIDPSSGVVGKTINSQVNPYAIDITQQKEDALRGLSNAQADLFSSRIEEMRSITNTIAQLKANGANQAITDALAMAQAQQAHKWDLELEAIRNKKPSTTYSSVQGDNGGIYILDSNGNLRLGANAAKGSSLAGSAGIGDWTVTGAN